MPNVCKHNERAASCWQCKDERITKLERVLEKRIVSFSGDRMLCLECRASASGTVADMEIRHTRCCPLAGTITYHPSR